MLNAAQSTSPKTCYDGQSLRHQLPELSSQEPALMIFSHTASIKVAERARGQGSA